MSRTSGGGRRILLIDDNPSIHEDFRKILAPRGLRLTASPGSEANPFFATHTPPSRTPFQIDSTLQGQEGVELARRALDEGDPFEMAFVDMRMSTGWDGLETIERIWAVDPDIQIVICTAYSDHSWETVAERLGHADRFMILKKPFDNIEVRQLAESMTEKWRLARQERSRFVELERRLRERKEDHEARCRIDARLDEVAATGDSETNSGLAAQGDRRALLARELRRAIGAVDEISVHYQPLVEIASRRVVGLEALARWSHPRLGEISPAEFIPLAEETGLILPLGELILREVCEQLAAWQRDSVAIVRTAVNLSAVQLERQPMDDVVRRILHESGVQPHQLALELTEGTLVKRLEDHGSKLARLRDDGVRIEVDDFGTGYSSLSYLKRLPIDTLKIDRSFIAQLDRSGQDEAIVSAILALARNLNLTAVAEGVERPEQLQVLGKYGCEMAQGYYFSRPLPVAECRQLLADLGARTSLTDTLRLRYIA